MANNSKVKMRLQGHEKFALREGWLNKGLIMVDRNPTAFLGKNGPDIFGIGNNMVKSLRYWLKAFGLIDEKPGKGAYLTAIGKLILENDPYFEDSFTLWILHSFIAKNIEEATSWYMFFNRSGVEDLSKEQIESILVREITKYASGTSFSEKSVKNDLDVLLNMYSKEKSNDDPEDKSQSPFAVLNLVKNVDGRYSKNHPNRKIINEWVVLYELSNLLEDKEFISIEDAVDGEKGLSNIYQLTGIVANELLDKLDTLDYIRINRTAGLDVIYKNSQFTATSVVEDYYKNKR